MDGSGELDPSSIRFGLGRYGYDGRRRREKGMDMSASSFFVYVFSQR